MRFDLRSRISGGARQILAALAILAIVGLATPSASAGVSLSYTVTGGAGGALTSGTSSGGTANDITYTVTATATDSSAGSSLSTTTINLNNTASTQETITIVVTGAGYTLGGLAQNGYDIVANYNVTGGGGPYNGSFDSASASSTVAFTSLGSSSGTISGSGGALGSTYSFTPSTSPTKTITLGTTSFSLGQTLTITLGGGDSSNFTFKTNVGPAGLTSVPEPSSMALAGLGGLGLIGYGLRRRRALGA